MSGEMDLEKVKREEARWRILKTLDAGRPGKLTETLILQIVNDAGLQVTQNELRRSLDYLRERKLIEIYEEQSPIWRADLTRYGIDLVEYTVECEAGVARPPKWW